MAKAFDLISAKCALLAFSKELVLAQPLKNFAQVLVVLFHSIAENQDVIKIDYYKLPQHVTKRVRHQPLEGSWCVTQAKWEYYIFIQPCRGQKCSSRNMGIMYLDLMVSAGQINT